MFNPDFYPTPLEVIEQMLDGVSLDGKTVLEPSAGKGNIVDFIQNRGANVIACEKNEDLKKIVQSKCPVIADDFLTVESHQISHIDAIVMNPPFSADEKHILHAYNIAPAGCKIVALCNLNTVKNTFSQSRRELVSIIEQFGSWQDLGECFTTAERKTSVSVALVTIQKAGANYSTEFEGFFMEEDPEEGQENGLMSYNAVRDLVNRYVAAIKVYDEQLKAGQKMHSLLNSFYGEKLAFTCTENGAPKMRSEFKKDLQKAGWAFIFQKMNLEKYATRGLREDINKFVEQQQNIPFTMRNIYRMLEIVAGTASQRMDKAILEVFDRVTTHYHDNRYNVKGWKTNSHYLVGKKFILPSMISPAKEYGYTSSYYNSLLDSYDGIIPDFEKALCFLTGEDYDALNAYDHTKKGAPANEKTIRRSIDRNTYGEWYESRFFKYKGYKNGNMHFEFVSDDVWGLFNQRVAKLKGFPLFEGKKQTAYQDRQTGRADQEKGTTRKHQEKEAAEVKILFRAKVA